LQAFKKNMKTPSINIVHIDITNRCNLRCLYCYNFQSASVTNKSLHSYEMSLSDIFAFIDQAIQLKAKYFVLSGGEPLLRNELQDIMKYLNSKKMGIVLLTNGTLLDRSFILFLKSLEHFIEIKVSYDGCATDVTRGVGLQKRIEEVLSLISAATLKLTINTMVNRFNENFLGDIYQHIKQYAPAKWQLDIPFYHGLYKINESTLAVTNLENIFLKFRELLISYFKDGQPFKIYLPNAYKPEMEKRMFYKQKGNMHPCLYNLGNITLRANGDVSFCPSLFFNFGNVKENDLLAILCSDRYQKFLKMKMADISDCRHCRYLYVCGTGCRANALCDSGDMMQKDSYFCRTMPFFEKYIVSLFSPQTRKSYEKLMR